MRYITHSIFEVISDSSSLVVDLPPHVGIKKIIASIRQYSYLPIDGGHIIIDTVFNHHFSKCPNVSVGIFETELDLPICIGSNGTQLILKPLNKDVTTIADILTITVVYYPSYQL